MMTNDDLRRRLKEAISSGKAAAVALQDLDDREDEEASVGGLEIEVALISVEVVMLDRKRMSHLTYRQIPEREPDWIVQMAQCRKCSHRFPVADLDDFERLPCGHVQLDINSPYVREAIFTYDWSGALTALPRILGRVNLEPPRIIFADENGKPTKWWPSSMAVGHELAQWLLMNVPQVYVGT